MMNGYRYSDLIGRSGKNLLLRIDGRRNVFYGSPAIPAQLAINGAEAAPSALIHAGDRIHFTPAQPGKDCVMTAASSVPSCGARPFSVKGASWRGIRCCSRGIVWSAWMHRRAFSSPGPGGAGPGFRPAPTACLSQRPAPYALPEAGRKPLPAPGSAGAVRAGLPTSGPPCAHADQRRGQSVSATTRGR